MIDKKSKKKDKKASQKVKRVIGDIGSTKY
jgi:hypothetical protein